MSASPLKTPKAFNGFKLDGVKSPGLAKIKSGGFREVLWQEQQIPGESGSNNVFRYVKVMAVTYSIEVWTDEHLAAWETFIAMLNTGRDKVPPRVYRFVDLRLAHNNVTSVSYGSCGPQTQMAPGEQRWSYELMLVERKPFKPFGGAVKPPANAIEAKIAQLDAENKALAKTLDSMNAAKKAGK